MNHLIRKLIIVSYSIFIPAITLLYLGGCTSKLQVDANVKQKSTQAQVSPDAKQKLTEKAQAITVRIYAGDNIGSGILLKQQDKIYTLVTNRHVIANEKSYQIQTPDGMKHQATLLDSKTEDDLALLQFKSDRAYTIAEIGNAAEQYDQELYASGFPYNSNKLQLSMGKFTLQLDSPLKNGYQIGYTNDIQSGMSGGAILDADGKVIGVNARSANPVLPDYQFADGSRPSKQQEKQLSQLSWGIPIYRVADLAPNLALIPASSKPLTSEADIFEFDPNTLTKAANDVYQTAQKITVRIDSKDGNGSGVIVAKQGNTYYVLTAGHVVASKNRQYDIVTVDGVKHSVEPSTISSSKEVDLAVAQFTSSKDYDVATLSTHQSRSTHRSNKEQATFLYGWARFNNQPKTTLSSGYLQPKDATFAITKDSFSGINGNDLIYTNFSYGGMSGGALLDSEGRVIGINTGVESVRDDLDRFYMGYSLGISTDNFFNLLKKLNLEQQWLNIDNSQPKTITAKDIQSLYVNNKYLNSYQEKIAHLDYQGWVNYGNLLWRTSNYEKAIEAFDRAIALKDNFYQAYYAKAIALGDSGKLQDKIHLLSQTIQINPEFYPAKKQIIIILTAGEEYLNANALFHINQSLETYPKSSFLHFYKAVNLIGLSHDKEALASIEQFLKLVQSKEGNDIYLQRANIYYYRFGKYQLALNDYNQAIKSNPHDASAYHNRGNLYIELKQYKLALDDYNQAIKLNSYDAARYNNRGIIYKILEQHELAINDYTQAIKLDSNYAEAYTERGNSYSMLGQKDYGLSDYKIAANLYKKQDNMKRYLEVQELIKSSK